MSGRPVQTGLFAGLFARGPVAAAVSDRAVLQAMLDAELALAHALAEIGLAPPHAVAELERVSDGAGYDIDAIGRSSGDKGTPIPGLLSAIRRRVSSEAAAVLHMGATSQDIVDTALMLVAGRALIPLAADLDAAADRCAALAERHRSTLQPGRTLLQQALPLTFGLKAAGWLAGLDGVLAELRHVRDDALAAQLGGAVGTLAGYGDRGLDVLAAFARNLGLPEPVLAWHTLRLPPARLAAALGTALGLTGKIARDVVLLAQTEVAEAIEAGGEGRGGSSTMPHKRNPVAAVGAVACATRGPGLVATILGAMVQEHERAAGAWQAEWEPLLELLRLAGSAASLLHESLATLELDPARMRQDLDITGSLIMSERVAGALAATHGRPAAQQLVERAARRAAEERRPLRDVLLDQPEIAGALTPDALDQALDPAGYLGVTGQLIDRALAVHRA